MIKRNLLKSFLALPLVPLGQVVQAAATITDPAVSFTWAHSDAGLTCTLEASTRGWVAVGFNSERRLKGTRFVMAARTGDRVRVEEYIARVPARERVAALGLAPAVTEAVLTHIPGGSRLRVTFSERFRDQPALSLAPGRTTHLMLAWSHETDFDHHSAWRAHYDITL